MGGAVNLGGSIISSAAALAGKSKSERDYYRAMASAADKQAALEQASAQRRAEYIFRSGARENNRLFEEYSSAAGKQKAALAAGGTGNSYTVQQIMQNSRWNWLADQDTLRQNTADSLYENNLAALLGRQRLTDESAQYRTLAGRASRKFLGEYVQSLMNIFKKK